jgi:hypothetical protein
VSEAAVAEIVGRGGDADDALRDVVGLLAESYAWAGILFVEEGQLVLGPSAGEERPDARTQLRVTYNGARVAELVVDGAPATDTPFLERVATLISAQCLVGWDTGGEPWNP